MSVIQYSKHVNSAELARCKEVTENGASRRRFEVTNDNEKTPAILQYASDYDKIYCSRCNVSDDCTHSFRLRMCGILTDTVTEKAGIEIVPRQRRKAVGE